MDLTQYSKNGLVIVGCGKMGSALLSGWINTGINVRNITVIAPNPSAWLLNQGVKLNSDLPNYHKYKK